MGKAIKVIAWTLLIVGGLNWGLVGILDIDLVKMMFGDMSVASRVIYILVGISAAYMAVMPSKRV